VSEPTYGIPGIVKPRTDSLVGNHTADRGDAERWKLRRHVGDFGSFLWGQTFHPNTSPVGTTFQPNPLYPSAQLTHFGVTGSANGGYFVDSTCQVTNSRFPFYGSLVNPYDAIGTLQPALKWKEGAPSPYTAALSALGMSSN
jgi:hypothetical protein